PVPAAVEVEAPSQMNAPLLIGGFGEQPLVPGEFEVSRLCAFRSCGNSTVAVGDWRNQRAWPLFAGLDRSVWTIDTAAHCHVNPRKRSSVLRWCAQSVHAQSAQHPQTCQQNPPPGHARLAFIERSALRPILVNEGAGHTEGSDCCQCSRSLHGPDTCNG